jgi:hypothetical protein
MNIYILVDFMPGCVSFFDGSNDASRLDIPAQFLFGLSETTQSFRSFIIIPVVAFLSGAFFFLRWLRLKIKPLAVVITDRNLLFEHLERMGVPRY